MGPSGWPDMADTAVDERPCRRPLGHRRPSGLSRRHGWSARLLIVQRYPLVRGATLSVNVNFGVGYTMAQRAADVIDFFLKVFHSPAPAATRSPPHNGNRPASPQLPF